MKRLRTIITNILVWGAVTAYLCMSVRMCRSECGNTMVSGVDIVVRDSAQRRFVTPAVVRGWLREAGVDLRNVEIGGVNTMEIERMVEGHGFVRSAAVYTTLKGRVRIEIGQRRPVARVNLTNGYDFYIADDGHVLPMQRDEVVYVPVITGSFTPPFEKGYFGAVAPEGDGKEKKYSENYIFFTKLINFVKLVEDNDYWRSQIVQINVLDKGTRIGGRVVREPQVEIVPRVGRHVVLLGSLAGEREKLDKLTSFYRGALRYEGWDDYKYLDLRFRGQIVCTRIDR